MNRPSTTGTILTFIVGLGVGAAAALLFAPKSGEELRSDIAGRFNDEVEELRSDIAGRFNDEVDNVRGEVRNARKNIKRRADKLVSMAKDEIQDVIDAGDEAYTEAKNA